nr:DUF6192 family protein [Streptomyces dangxiongensis]
MFADDIGVERRTVEDWRYTANRWPEERRKEGVSFTVHRILASVVDEDERWAAIEDAPLNPRTGARQWTPDGANHPGRTGAGCHGTDQGRHRRPAGDHGPAAHEFPVHLPHPALP